MVVYQLGVYSLPEEYIASLRKRDLGPAKPGPPCIC
jgi:hypothetical protein